MKNKLNDLLKKTYSPYSKVKVASIVVTNDGKEYNGVNIENASYSGTVCAERVAMFNAITEGAQKGDLKELHITSNMKGHLYPCSICRQIMTEFFDENTKIHIHSNDSEEIKIETLESLVPNSVNKESFSWE